MQRLIREEPGQGMAEYGLILALVSIAAIAILRGMGDQFKVKFNDVIEGLGGSRITG
jgi:pilus assembly protein Flp/PilA